MITIQSPPLGWAFYSADFSIIASGGGKPGSVLLVRSPVDCARWGRMSDEQRDRVNLYIRGDGANLTLAMADAVDKALVADPVEDPA